MATYCVYHLIHVRTPHRHIPKLVIRGVPNGETVHEDLIDRAGYNFSEFGIAWANHIVCQVDAKDSPADLVSRIRRGEAEEITFKELIDKAEAPL